MRSKSFICLFSALIMAVSLCGCNLFTVETDELLNPPSLTGDMRPIAEALSKSINGEYTLKYPSRGTNRSAVIQNDINNDGTFEAFAFYSITDGDTTTMHINLICRDSDKENWKSVSEQKIVAGGVDMIDFCDLDGDGVMEILVGWEIYGKSEMQLAVYSYTDNSLSQRMLQQYTYFMCCDLNEDNSNEIFLLNFNSANSANTAKLYELKKNSVNEFAGCKLDGSVKTVKEPVLSTLSSGKPAIYIDEIKGAGAITEVLFFEKGELINPLLNKETGENSLTLRSSSIMNKDINDDKIIEIPVQRQVPSALSDTPEKLYLTDWCSYNGEVLTSKLTAIMNFNDGYYIALPERLLGHISVLKDTENRIRTIYTYDPETHVSGEKIAYLQAFDESDWDSGKYKASELTVLRKNNGIVYAAWVSNTAGDYSIKIDELQKGFQLIS